MMEAIMASTIHSSAPPVEPLLTVDDIRHLKLALEEDERLFSELPDRIAKKKRRYEAALLFLPDGFNLDAATAGQESLELVLSSDEPPPEKLTWISGVENFVAANSAGVAHQAILTALKSTELGERPSKGDKGFYNAIARLIKQGKLVKHGGLLYSKDLYERLKKGKYQFPMALDGNLRPGGAASLVLEVLEKYPQGLSSTALKDLVAARDDAPKSISEHGNYIFNVLAGLIGKGKVVRKNGLYFAEEQL